MLELINNRTESADSNLKFANSTINFMIVSQQAVSNMFNNLWVITLGWKEFADYCERHGQIGQVSMELQKETSGR